MKRIMNLKGSQMGDLKKARNCFNDIFKNFFCETNPELLRSA